MPARPRSPLPLILLFILCGASFFFDDQVIAFVHHHSTPALLTAARFFTKWGDFPPVAALLLVLLLTAHLRGHALQVRLLALMLGCASASGVTANLLRVLTGRARPSAHLADSWYGMKTHGAWIAGRFQYASFPSGHTAVVMGAVIPLFFFSSKRWAYPALLLALGVAASRILLNSHHLSDVLCATWLALLISTLLSRRFPPRSLVESPASASTDPA